MKALAWILLALPVCAQVQVTCPVFPCTITVNATTPPPVQVTVTVAPTSATVQPGGTQQFLATVTGSANTAVTWSIAPGVGSISTLGLYTAPANVPTVQTITVTATSQADPTKSASAQLTLAANPPPITTTVKLPVEVLGPDGYTVNVPVTIASVPAGAQQATLQVHGLHYDAQGSVQVNGSPWLPLSNGGVTLAGLANAYGGIGGGFSTFSMTVNLPAGTIVSGANSVNFKFNGTNGRVSGFRVLAFNLMAGGTALLPASTFTQDDPSTWTPPFSDAINIAAGKNLWYTAALKTPTNGTMTAINAHCTDCHSQDGRDLKYFNYSNWSVRVRSMFHGLTQTQGDQIASYIRTLSQPAPGRPWNPPYQPGPGLDSQPVASWAAGAGLGAVLANDGDMLAYLMPGGSSAAWAPLANLSARETPITMQLPDWNAWLPSIWPGDAWPGSFPQSTLYTNYQALRKNLVPGNAAAYKANSIYMWLWISYDKDQFFPTVTKPNTDPAWQNPQFANSILSLRAWDISKMWEINQEYGLEGMAQQVFVPIGDARSWYSPLPFFVSPNMIQTPTTGVIGNGSNTTFLYMEHIWYQLQLVLNWSNNRGTCGSLSPVGPSSDWPYVYNDIDGFAYISSPASPQGGLTLEWLIKGLQASQNGCGPDKGSTNGWAPSYNTPWRLATYGVSKWGNNMTAAQRTAAMNAYLGYWVTQAATFTPAQYYAGMWASSTETIDPNNMYTSWGNSMAYSIPVLKYYGVSSTLLNQLVAFCKGVWPQYNWAGTLTQTCTPSGNSVNCK